MVRHADRHHSPRNRGDAPASTAPDRSSAGKKLSRRPPGETEPSPAIGDLLSELISIIIPTRNRARVLQRSLECLARQTCDASGFEVIVVDDCSADQTADLLARWASRIPAPIRFFCQPSPRGANAARNRGVSEARGEVVVFLDDDVLVPEGWLQALISGFHASGLPVATGPVRLSTESKLPGRHRQETATFLTEVLGPVVHNGTAVPVSANMVGLRRYFERTPFDEAVQAPNEETDWLLRSGARVAFLPAAWVWHQKSAAELRRLRLLRLAWRRGGENGRWTREKLGLSFGRRVGEAQHALATAVKAYGHGLLCLCWGGFLVGTAQTSHGLALLGLSRRKSFPRAEA